MRTNKKQKIPFLGNDYKKPLKSETHETLAGRLYEALNQMGGIEFKKLSRSTARRLVATYDAALLGNTLDRIKKRSMSGSIRNPVGFFITLMRSESRTMQSS